MGEQLTHAEFYIEMIALVAFVGWILWNFEFGEEE